MGSTTSTYVCKNIADPTAKAERAICMSSATWLKDDTVKSLWIVWSVIWGIISTVAYYMSYLSILEILRSLPVDYVEYLGGDIEYEAMRWPPTFGIDSEDSAGGLI